MAESKYKTLSIPFTLLAARLKWYVSRNSKYPPLPIFYDKNPETLPSSTFKLEGKNFN